MFRALVFLLLVCAAHANPLLVISVDGLDYRYLRDADKLGMKVPNMRRLMREGSVAQGVVGVVPTVTWPSHTTLITGVPPIEHGILNNRRPQPEGGEYYWSAALLKRKTLLDIAHANGMKTAAITWPVTVDAPVDFNLPEYFKKRNGGAMDLASIESKGTPGLVEKITARFPSFPQEWMDDRTRALAARYLLENGKPDLILVHMVDHDAAAHDHGPFGREARAVLEYTDELIGSILGSVPKNMVVALVSDHGFERTDQTVDLTSLEKQSVTITPFLLTARTEDAAAKIRKLAGVGRQVPADELRRLAPQYGAAAGAWEPAEHFAFTKAEGGNHGLWPTRPDYRSVFVLWGPGVKAVRTPEIQMTEIAGKLAAVLGVAAPN